MKLYSYWRSTAAYRVRIALNLKGLEAEQVGVDLVESSQHEVAYTGLNPSHLVPTLITDDGTVLTQSLAIIEWLDTACPAPALLPKDPSECARVRAAAYVVAMDIHPVNNLRVLNRLSDQFGAGNAARIDWMNHWMALGFASLETLVRPDTEFAFAETPGLADICITAQFYNARRWGCDLAPFPRLTEIEQTCLGLDAFERARPENQPDAT